MDVCLVDKSVIQYLSEMWFSISVVEQKVKRMKDGRHYSPVPYVSAGYTQEQRGSGILF